MNNNTAATEKPVKKPTAEQKAKAKEKLAKKRAALKEKRRLAREKKAARLEKKRAAKKAVREAKKAKKLARLEKKRARMLKVKELKKARLEKKRARLAAQKAKVKELKAKQKAKAAKVAVEKVDLKNVPIKDLAKELTKRLKYFAKVLANNTTDVAEREELTKRIEKDGVQIVINNDMLTTTLSISADTRVITSKQPAVKCAAIATKQPKKNVQIEAVAKVPLVEAEATEVPIGDTYGNEPTDEELAAIEAEQIDETADDAENEEETEEIDTRSDVDDDQADFRREFFGNSENTEDFE